MTFDELENPKTFLPGVEARHVVISNACREEHGDDGAAAEATQRIAAELKQLLKNWSPKQGATFHLLVTVGRAGRGDAALGG